MRKITGDNVAQICSPSFCAGFIYEDENGFITDAAPRISWVVGKRLSEVVKYCEKEGWKLILISERR